MSRFFVPMNFVAVNILSTFLVIIQFGYGAPVVEIGKVTCTLFLNSTELSDDAYRTCSSKFEDLNKKFKKEGKQIPYPWNSTIEEFEYDDKCMERCVYEESKMIEKDAVLPKTSDTETLFPVKGKVSDGLYKMFTDVWNKCIEISEKISKAKKFDKCKTASHHYFCVQKIYEEDIFNKEVECN